MQPHIAAALLTLFVLPYAAVHSYNHGGTLESVSVSIYIISIFMMFISSTIYHSMQNYTAHKYILRIIDHSMIYVAISGTYTPVLLTIVGGWIGWVVTLFLWGLHYGEYYINPLLRKLIISSVLLFT